MLQLNKHAVDVSLEKSRSMSLCCLIRLWHLVSLAKKINKTVKNRVRKIVHVYDKQNKTQYVAFWNTRFHWESIRIVAVD